MPRRRQHFRHDANGSLLGLRTRLHRVVRGLFRSDFSRSKTTEPVAPVFREPTADVIAALHDLTEQSIRDIVKEGDMKNWDSSARSRAYRHGERVFKNEQTQQK